VHPASNRYWLTLGLVRRGTNKGLPALVSFQPIQAQHAIIAVPQAAISLV